MSSITDLIETAWKSPNVEILDRIAQNSWTAHNIPLTTQRSTMPNSGNPLIGDESRTRVIKKNMDLFLGSDVKAGSPYRGRVVDLGCLEGGISFEMARAGFDVLGIEGRASNFTRCDLIEQYYRLPNLRFEHLDVKDLSIAEHGYFDAIICCGLLYHLDDPVTTLRLLAELAQERGIMFLDTHVAPSDTELANCVFRDALSDMTEIAHGSATYSGRWYHEYAKDGHSDDPWASVSNYRSFWLTRPALIMALDDVGFNTVYEIYGTRPARQEQDLRLEFSRVYLVALKQPLFRLQHKS
jgi:2-polyprenyl-3-methyl-5-hydroxy-6-metoxy-1,4-benzoquinol methylase